MAIAVHLVHGDAAWQSAAGDAIAAAAGASIGTPRWTRCGGSSLNDTWRLDLAATSYFVKVNAAERAAMLEAEADGLKELGAAKAVRVPAPVACGVGGRRGVPGARVARLRTRRPRCGARPRAGRTAPVDRAAVRRKPRQHDRHDAAGQRVDRRLGRVLPRPPDRAAAGARSAQRPWRASASATASVCWWRFPRCLRATRRCLRSCTATCGRATPRGWRAASR